MFFGKRNPDLIDLPGGLFTPLSVHPWKKEKLYVVVVADIICTGFAARMFLGISFFTASGFFFFFDEFKKPFFIFNE